MSKDDLVQATSEDDLSPNGQRTSVPTTRTMGQVAFEQRFGTGTFWDQQSEGVWKSWAGVADAVIEECAKTISTLAGSTQELKLHLGEMSAQEMRTLRAGLNLAAHILRSSASPQRQGDRPVPPHGKRQREPS